MGNLNALPPGHKAEIQYNLPPLCPMLPITSWMAPAPIQGFKAWESSVSSPFPYLLSPPPSDPQQAFLRLQANSLYIPLPQASPMHQGHCSQSLLDPWLLLLPSCIPSSSRLAKPFENLSQITSLSYLKPIRASCCSQSTIHALGRGCDLAAASQAPSPAALTTHFLSPPLKPWNIPHTL